MSQQGTPLTDRFSPSGLDTWLKCEAQWSFRYVEGLRRPPSAAMTLGSGFDDAANDYYLEKRSFGQDPSDSDTRDRFAAAFDRRAADVEDWGEEKRAAMLDEGVAGVSSWRERVALHVEPEQVQPRFEQQYELPAEQAEANEAAGIGNVVTLRGYLDLIGTVPKRGRLIVDHKFSRRSWTPADVSRETQPVVYGFAFGVPVFQFHVLRRTKGTPATKILTRAVTQGDIAATFQRIAITRRKVAVAVQTGDFLPNRKQPLCSRRWCGYWQECERKYGGRVTD